jgi:hypothetical protein
MKTSRKLAHALLASLALLLMTSAAFAADPGLRYPVDSELSDQKAGSLLFFNFYTSGATSGNAQNTSISISNTSTTSAAFVHLFFVSDGCAVADRFLCFTARETSTFLASDIDPGVSGYIVAIAVDGVNGCPVEFNWLIGEEYVKLATGHHGGLGAEAFSALFNGILPGCDANSVTALIAFTGTFGGYNLVPAVLALSGIPSRADGNDTLLVVNRVGGNLAIGAATLGTLFGQLYDDAENGYSFSVTGSCQLRASLSNTFPRTTPRFEDVIPSAHSGWLHIGNLTAAIGLLGSAINFNPNLGSAKGAFVGSHNLHKLTLTTASYTIPIFAPSC